MSVRKKRQGGKASAPSAASAKSPGKKPAATAAQPSDEHAISNELMLESSAELHQAAFKPETMSNMVRNEKRPLGPTALALRRLYANKLAMIGLAYICLLLFSAFVGIHFWKYQYDVMDGNSGLLKPSWEHPMGTDEMGRDLLARVLKGAQVSLLVGIFASLISVTVGVVYGGIAGYLGGGVGRFMMRVIDIIYAIPLLLIVIMMILVMEPDANAKAKALAEGSIAERGEPFIDPRMMVIFLAMGITYWLPMARVVRAKVLQLRDMEFALAARATGVGHARLLFRHLLPNSLGPIIVMVTLNIPEAIFAEAFLSYIGLGVTAPLASWGTLASDGTAFVRTQNVYLLLFPAAAISSTMLAFNFLGDGLRDAFDPQQRNT